VKVDDTLRRVSIGDFRVQSMSPISHEAPTGIAERVVSFGTNYRE